MFVYPIKGKTMKNILLKATVCMLAFCSMGLLDAKAMGPAPLMPTTTICAQIKNNPWSENLEKMTTDNWNRFSNEQKTAILERLGDQGLLSQYEVDSWDLNKAPAPFTMGG
jgi:hypothetical protein